MGREVGNQDGFAAFCGEEGIALAEAGGFDCLGDIEDVVALGDSEGDGVDITANDAFVDLGGGRGVVEAVFAGKEPAALYGTEEVEGIAAAQDAGVFKLRSDRPGCGAGRDIDVD